MTPGRLGFYVLPGHVTSITSMADEVRDGAELGFGAVLVSERLNIKHSAVLSGYAAALAGPAMEVAVALTFANTRHPMDMAAFGASAAALAQGGFTMGLGRGPNHQWDAWGMPRPRLAQLEDAARVLSRLWAGETVTDHDGPLGRFPGSMRLGVELERVPRIGLGTLGPKGMEAAGRSFDDLFLHTHWSEAGIAASAATARRAAERAGRDPAALRVWSLLAVACDLPEEAVLQRIVRRMTTYMQWPGYGELIVAANGWDPEVLTRLRSHPLLAGRMADTTRFSTDELREIRSIYPPEWISEGAAIGSPEEVARRVRAQFAAGADRVVLHGNAPRDLGGIVAAMAGAEGDAQRER